MDTLITDVMVDLETTGTSSPDRNGIIQIAAIGWNYDTGDIGPTFDRCPSLIPGRYWDEDCRGFWSKNKPVYDGIIARQEPAVIVYKDFINWVISLDKTGEGLRFWSKPLSFDWPLLASHIQQMGGPMPFFYRTARDVNSVCAALKGRMEHPNMEAIVSSEGYSKHNALHDCAYQIDCVLEAKAGNFSEIIQ